jgi:hypothetical protein
MKLNNSFLLAIAFLLMLSCGVENKETKKSYLPVARGKAGVILIVMDTGKYNADLGLALRKVLAEPILGLPQPEPYFTIQNINPLKLNKLLKAAKNMIFVTTLDGRSRQNRELLKSITNDSKKRINTDTSLYMLSKQDDFARGQQVLHLFGKDDESLIKKIKQNRSKILNYFNQTEKKRLMKKLFRVEETNLTNVLIKDHEFSLRLPLGFELAKNTENFAWMRVLDDRIEKNIFVYHEPYASQEPFEDPLAFREKITRKFMTDVQKPDIIMTLQDVPSTTSEINLSGKYAKQTKGLWKLSDISGGGPFLSYVFVDESQKRIYYLEGYVYAPSKNKREPMREISVILDTFKSGVDLKASKK